MANRVQTIFISSQSKFLAKLFQSVTVKQLNRRSAALFEHEEDFSETKKFYDLNCITERLKIFYDHNYML